LARKKKSNQLRNLETPNFSAPVAITGVILVNRAPQVS
jgi:hypothetical protein